jgi:hypothetical protein
MYLLYIYILEFTANLKTEIVALLELCRRNILKKEVNLWNNDEGNCNKVSQQTNIALF